MRGALIVGLAGVLLIIGLLVMKNMGADDSDGNQNTQAEAYIDKAQKATDDVNSRLKDIRKQARAQE